MAQRTRWWTTALVGVLASAVAYGCDPGAPAPPIRTSPGWVPVHEGLDPDNRGSTVRIAVDTTGARPLADGAYLVWFETRHSRPRIEAGRSFDRELIRLALRCAPGAHAAAYKTVDALLLDGESPPVYQEGTAVTDLDRRPWRAVKAGSADSVAFGRACAFFAPEASGHR